MTNPLLDLFPQQKNPLDDLFQSPPREPLAPGVAGLKQLLARPDLSDEQRTRIEGLIAKFEPQDQSDNLAKRIGKAFVQGAAKPFVDIGNTLLPGQPLNRVDQALETNVPPGMSEGQSTANAIAETAAYTAGNFLAQAKVFQGAAKVADLLGAGASKVAPGITARALAAVAKASARASEVNPLLGGTVAAAPKQVMAGIIQQGLQDPQSLTTPKGIALTAGFSLFGALTDGQQRAKAISAFASNAKNVESLKLAQDMLDAMAKYDDMAPQVEAFKQIERRAGNQAPAGDPNSLPSQLEAGLARYKQHQDEALATIAERMKALSPRGESSTLPPVLPEAQPGKVERASAKRDARLNEVELGQATYLAALDDFRERFPGFSDQEYMQMAAADAGLRSPPTNLIEPAQVNRPQEGVILETTRNNQGVRQQFKNAGLTQEQRVIRQAKIVEGDPIKDAGLNDYERGNANYQQQAKAGYLWINGEFRQATEADVQQAFKTAAESEQFYRQKIAKIVEVRDTQGESAVQLQKDKLHYSDTDLNTSEQMIKSFEKDIRDVHARAEQINRQYQRANPAIDLMDSPLNRTPQRPLTSNPQGVRLIGVEPDVGAKLWAAGSDIPGAPLVGDPGVAQPVRDPLRRVYGPKPGQESPPSSPIRAIERRSGLLSITEPELSAQASGVEPKAVKPKDSVAPDPDLPVYTNHILSQIEPAGAKPPRTMRGLWENLRKHLEKSTVALGKYVEGVYGTEKKNVPTFRNFEDLADHTRGSTSSIDYLFNQGTFRFTEDGNIQTTQGPALTKILDGVKDNFKEFKAYLIANRVVNDPNYAGKAKNVDPHMARLQVENAPANVRQAAAQWIEWNRGVRQLAEDEGLLEGGIGRLFDSISEAYTYLPRAFEPAPKPTNLPQPKTFGAAKELFQNLVGGDKKFKDPVFASIDRAERVVRAVYRNRAVRVLGEAVEQNPDRAKALGLSVVMDKGDPAYAELEGVARNFRDNMQEQGQSVSIAEARRFALLFSDKAPKSDRTVAYWKNGEIVKINAPTDVVEAFNSLNPRDMNIVAQWLGLGARGLKAGVTLNPVFQLFNFIRDSYDATLNSRYGFKFGVDSFLGFMEAVKKGSAYKEWLAAGGGFGTITSSNVRTAAKAYDMISPSGKVVRLVKHPVEVWKEFISPMEEAARIGEYMRAKKAGASALEAAMASRRVTTDFSQIGLSTQAWSYMTAFFNPAIQSLANNAKSAVDHPKGFAVKGITAITLPTMYLWAANRNDEEIQQLRKSNAGLTFWFTRLPSGDIVRLPKPFIYGQIFGTAMEAALDKWADSDPRSAERMIKGLADQVTVNMLPTAVQAYIAIHNNRDNFTDQPIVPLDAQDRTPEHQVQFFTGRSAKWLGDQLGYSPAKLEFLARQLGGTLASSGLRAIDAGVELAVPDPNAPASPVAADMPVLGGLFARYPSMSAASVQEFYDSAEKVGQIFNTVQYLERERPQELQQFLTANAEAFAAASVYAETRKQISELRNTVDVIQNAPLTVMSRDAKREKVDYILRQIIELTKSVNSAVLHSDLAETVY